MIPEKLAKHRDEWSDTFLDIGESTPDIILHCTINQHELLKEESRKMGWNACYEEMKPLIEALKRIRDNANTIGYLPESHFVSNNSVAIFNSNDIARTALKKVGIE